MSKTVFSFRHPILFAGIHRFFFAASAPAGYQPEDYSYDELRNIYTQDSSLWPAPHVDEGIDWKELQAMPGESVPQPG